MRIGTNVLSIMRGSHVDRRMHVALTMVSQANQIPQIVSKLLQF